MRLTITNFLGGEPTLAAPVDIIGLLDPTLALAIDFPSTH
jgi:hypothetical protein